MSFWDGILGAVLRIVAPDGIAPDAIAALRAL
jgi:hypothetical protein